MPVIDAPQTAVLVAAAPFSNDGAAASRLKTDALRPETVVIGVDGGTRTLLSLGIQPDVVTGDFDSLDSGEVEALRQAGTRVVATPDQDFTDLDKALGYVARVFPDVARVRIFGAIGGRLDHTFAGLSAALKHAETFARIILVDDIGETTPVRAHETLVLSPESPDGTASTGSIVSLIALGAVSGITTTGVRWPLNSEMLAPGIRDGTSNIAMADLVTITHESGDLLVMLHHPVNESG